MGKCRWILRLELTWRGMEAVLMSEDLASGYTCLIRYDIRWRTTSGKRKRLSKKDLSTVQSTKKTKDSSLLQTLNTEDKKVSPLEQKSGKPSSSKINKSISKNRNKSVSSQDQINKSCLHKGLKETVTGPTPLHKKLLEFTDFGCRPG